MCNVQLQLVPVEKAAQCRGWQGRYSKFTEALPTRAFLVPLDEDEEVEAEISKGNVTHIKYRAMGELQPNGTRSARLWLCLSLHARSWFPCDSCVKASWRVCDVTVYVRPMHGEDSQLLPCFQGAAHHTV